MTGRRIVITGAAGEIGSACCRHLLEDGHRIVGVDIDEAAGKALIDSLAATDRLSFIAADVTDEAAVEHYVAEAVSRLGAIDGFFNNAGIEGDVVPIIAYPSEVFDRVVAVNLRACSSGSSS